MSEDKFSIFIPLEIEKGSGTGEDRYANMKIKGIASNPNQGMDKQGQWLDPSGFDLSDFVKSGHLNYHHLWKDKPLTIVGEPTVARVTKNNELYVEGKLYKDSQVARDLYDLGEILEKNSDTRRLGFSIEGTVIKKDPLNKNRIIKSKITQLAITPAPICPGTKMELMKGGLDDLKFDDNEDQEFLIDIVDNGVRYTVDRNLQLVKAMVAGETTGRETADQSLSQEPLKQESIAGKKKKKKVAKQQLSKGEVFSHLVSEYDLDNESCKRVWELSQLIEKKMSA